MARLAVRLQGERLSRAMVVAGVTPAQLAQDAGVSPNTVSRARAGQPIAQSSCVRIAVALAKYPRNAAVEALLPEDGR